MSYDFVTFGRTKIFYINEVLEIDTGIIDIIQPVNPGGSDSPDDIFVVRHKIRGTQNEYEHINLTREDVRFTYEDAKTKLIEILKERLIVFHDNTLVGDSKNTLLGVNVEIISTKEYTDSQNDILRELLLEHIKQINDNLEKDYATKNEIPTKVSQLENDSEYANIEFVSQGLNLKQDKGDYATKDELSSGLNLKQDKGDYATRDELSNGLDAKQDKGDYATKDELNLKANKNEIPDVSNFITEIPDIYITDEELNDKHYLVESDLKKGEASGIATLDSNAKIPLSQINDSLIGNVQYQGLYDVSTNTPNLDKVQSKGYYYIVSVGGARYGIEFEVGDWIISNGDSWTKVDNTDAVSSVNGRTGNVVITKDDLDLSDYVKNTDYASATVAGAVKASAYYACATNASGFLLASPKSLRDYPNMDAATFISKGTLENIKDDYVKRGLTVNAIELTDEEKTAARTWLGAVGNTDYATDGKVGVIKGSGVTGLYCNSSGNLVSSTASLSAYTSKPVTYIIGKGTLENIKDDYVKRGLTENSLTFTDDEKAKAITLIGAGSQTDLNKKADDNKVVHLAGSENITGVKTFTLPDNIKFTASKTAGYTPSMTNATNGLTPATNVPWSRNGWHDHFAFGQSFVIYSKEVSTDGETWVADDRDVSYLFAQKEYGNTGETVLAPNAGEMGFRFVLQSANIAYSNIQWIEIGFAYTTTHTVRLLIESSPDGAEWTEVHNSTTGASATNKYLYVGNLSGANTYLRISIIKLDTTYLDAITRMLYVKGWTTRKGNQGRGIEYEKPYFWDNVPNLMPIKSSGCNLGSTSRRWGTTYTANINVGGQMFTADNVKKLNGLPTTELLTQAEYNALVTKDANTLYLIEEE